MVRRYMLIMILLIHGRYIYNLDAHINDGRDDFVFPSVSFPLLWNFMHIQIDYS
jgi:hypothetical protein